MKTRGARRSVVITSLAASRAEDIRYRQRRYVFAMLFRVVCLLAAVLLFSGPVRVVAVVFAVIMPWLAVIFANQPRLHTPAPALKVEEQAQRDRGLAPGREPRIIDAE